MASTCWGNIAKLRYGKALVGYKSNIDGPVRVFGTNGPIGYTDESMSEGPDIIIGRKGAYRGVHMSEGPSWVIDTAYYLELHDEIDLRWAYYALKNSDVNGLGSGSAVPSTTRDDFYALEVKVPSMSIQRSIAEVLGALDDKIAANTKLAESIPDLLHSIFRSIVNHGELQVPFGDLATVTKGVSYKSVHLESDATALVTLKSFVRTGGYSPRGLKEYSGPYKSDQVVSPGELVVAQTDLTQAAEVVGRAVRVPKSLRHDILVASLDLAIVRPAQGIPAEFLLGVMSAGPFREHCKANTSGTTVLHLRRNAIEGFQAPLVDSATQHKYATAARPLLDTIDSLEAESTRLAELRDALLPQLMSGKLRVKDAEEVASAAI